MSQPYVDMDGALRNFATTLEAAAVRADQGAASHEGRASFYRGYAPGPVGQEMASPELAAAEKLRMEAAELRYRASKARDGQFVVDPTRMPDRADQDISALASRYGRVVAVSARDWPVVAAAFLTTSVAG